MRLFRSGAMPQPAETQCATEPLPLFRPEVLSRQERFFGEALLIRPFSFGFLAWLVAGASALAYCVFFFGTYTETAHLRGVVLRGPKLENSRFTRPEYEAFLAVPSLHVAIKPGTPIAISCLQCADPAAQFPAIAHGVSSVAAPAAKADSTSARQILEFSYEASAASSFKQLLVPGTAVELALPIRQRRLFELFEPSSVHGNSQP
jgi:hypothetical protein